MDTLLSDLKSIRTPHEAEAFLFSKISFDTNEIKEAINFITHAHEGQFRKSGEPYVVHPLLVAATTAMYGDDKSMVLAALLHDVVEDTHFEHEHIAYKYGEDVGNLVDGLTKIDEIREHELLPSSTDEKLLKSALSFRKMLSAAITDPRVLVIKLCDRLHNLVTIDALTEKKQKRVAEESLVVYAPIAYKLGISKLKNHIEDLSFKVLFPAEYIRIDHYIKENEQKVVLWLNTVIVEIEKVLMEAGYSPSEFAIKSRVKHYYSIYQKMQRKGISIEEVLDLLALRILLPQPLDCYKVLGLLHQHFKPLIARFKDYIAIPKGNGYQTLHTTLFYESSIFEVQIRTFDMEQTAEYGIAAHFHYKSGVGHQSTQWLKNLHFGSENNVEEFYELAKNDLFSEDILVYSPKGELFNLPRGATALDFAYTVHTSVGDRAQGAFINKQKASLLQELKSGDICRIELAAAPIPRCSWLGSVKTSRAKHGIKNLCNLKTKEIDRRVAKNIMAFALGLDYYELREWLDEAKYTDQLYKVPRELFFYQELLRKVLNESRLRSKSLFTRLMGAKLKEYRFEHLSFYSTSAISDVGFDVCCHPKKWDDVVAFYQKGKAVVHHKLCTVADEMISRHEKMIFIVWSDDTLRSYRVVVSLENNKGSLARFVQYLAKLDLNITSIELGKSGWHTEYCYAEVEMTQDFKSVKDKIAGNFKLIEFTAADDAYKGAE